MYLNIHKTSVIKVIVCGCNLTIVYVFFGFSL